MRDTWIPPWDEFPSRPLRPSLRIPLPSEPPPREAYPNPEAKSSSRGVIIIDRNAEDDDYDPTIIFER